jgi:hypothetical protein
MFFSHIFSLIHIDEQIKDDSNLYLEEENILINIYATSVFDSLLAVVFLIKNTDLLLRIDKSQIRKIRNEILSLHSPLL